MKRSLARTLVLPIYLPGLVVFLGQGLLIPVMPIYATTLTNSYGLMGLMLAGGALGMLTADLPAGLLLARFGRKRTMLMGIVGVVTSVAALYWARTLLEVTACRFVTGASMSLWAIGRHSYLAEATSSHQRGRAISTFGGLMRIGRFISPAVGGLLAEVVGIRPTFLCSALVVGLAAPLVLIFVPADTPSPGPRSHAGRSLFAGYAQVIREQWRDLMTGGSGQLLAQMIRAGRRVLVPLYANQVLGLGYKEVGLIVSLGALADVVTFIPAGILMDRLGRKFAIVPCFAIQAVGIALVPATTGLFSLLAASCLMGLGNGLGSGSMMTLGADLSTPQRRGEFLGLWRLIGDAGAGGSPLLVGAVSQALSLGAAAFVVSGVGFLASAVFLFLVPETLIRSSES